VQIAWVTAGVSLDGLARQTLLFGFLGMHSCAPGPAGNSRSAEVAGQQTNHQQVISDHQGKRSAGHGLVRRRVMGWVASPGPALPACPTGIEEALYCNGQYCWVARWQFPDLSKANTRTRTGQSTPVDCWPVCADGSSSTGSMTETALLLPRLDQMAQPSGREVDSCGLLARWQKHVKKPTQAEPRSTNRGRIGLGTLSVIAQLRRHHWQGLVPASTRALPTKVVGPATSQRLLLRGPCWVHVTPTTPTLTARYASVGAWVGESPRNNT
jgi:hypothetical protein